MNRNEESDIVVLIYSKKITAVIIRIKRLNYSGFILEFFVTK
jgi:hypothetical protein